jgi:hypothetical protein
MQDTFIIGGGLESACVRRGLLLSMGAAWFRPRREGLTGVHVCACNVTGGGDPRDRVDICPATQHQCKLQCTGKRAPLAPTQKTAVCALPIFWVYLGTRGHSRQRKGAVLSVCHLISLKVSLKNQGTVQGAENPSRFIRDQAWPYCL